MGFEKRDSAKKYTSQDGDTLRSLAEKETANGNEMTWQDLAKFNWGTDDQREVNAFMRDELGCHKRDADNNFVFSSNDEPKGDPLLIPKAFKRLGLPIDKTHVLRVKKKVAPLQFLDCACIPGVTFEFDKSFIRPSVVDVLKKLEEALAKHPDGKLMIFGHTDKVGSEQYNKKLSERRAKSVFAFITNDAAVWESLYNEENWGTRVIQEMLVDFGFDPGPIDGINGPKTQAAVKEYQGARGLSVDGVAGPATRKVMFTEYMSSKHDIKATAGQFMDPKHMGCSEFNPVEETEAANEPNRRVTVFLFNPARLPKLPCKFVDIAPCKKQMTPPAPRFKETFKCSFFDSLARDCKCEGGDTPPPPVPVLLDVNPLILFAIAEPTITAAEPAAKQSFVSAAAPSATGAVTPLRDIVLVKKPYTNPTRVEVVLKTDKPFDGDGLLSVSDANSILLFPTRTSKVPLTFNGTDNKFTGAQLDPTGPGVSLFAEGKTASKNMRDFVMTLRLSGGTKKPGPDAVGRMTAIELVLDIGAPRVNATTAPVPLPQAPQVPAATPDDKFFLGRPVPIQDAAKIQERAMLIVQPVTTAGFAALNKQLVLVRIGSNITTFARESRPTPPATDVVIPPRHTFFSTNQPTTFFVEGVSESAKARDNSYQLGIDGLEGDGDRVQVTVVHSEIVSNRKPADVHTVARVPEKPERATRSTFFPAPIIIGRHFPIELRPFVLVAKPTAFQWTSQGGATLTLTDVNSQVLKLTATTRSAAENDTLIQVRVTSDLGVFLRRHRLTSVEVTIDPVSANHPFTATSDVNSIKNPPAVVILAAADQNDATKVAKIEMIKFGNFATGATVADSLGIEPTTLNWTDDDDRISWWIIGDDGKEYKGKADFRNTDAAKRGTKIEVFGTQEGDVLIQPYSGGFGYGMFRATVFPLRQIKYRINRVFTRFVAAAPGKPGRAAHAPTRSHVDARRHIDVANIFLRQVGIQLIPDNSNQMAAPRPGNAQIGLPGLDRFVVAVTQGAGATPGSTLSGAFDVEVNDVSLTFRATDARSDLAIQINARNEIITFAYIESLSTVRAVAQTSFAPTNHTPGRLLKDKGTPSSSLIPKSGIPNQTPVSEVRMVVGRASVGPQPPTPANGNRHPALLWGISVPTRSSDLVATQVAMTQDLLYGSTLAHEVGHVLGLDHRAKRDAFPDNQTVPRDKNLMFPGTTQNMESLDIVQCKAIRNSEVLRRNP